MAPGVREWSPAFKARVTGVFYLLTPPGGVFAQSFVSDRLLVSGDAAATTAQILTHRSSFQLGFTVYLIEMACQVTMTASLYDLLKPVSRSLSLLAAIFSLTGCAIKTFSRRFDIAPLFVLGDAHYLSVFSAPQLQALALLSLEANGQGAAIGLAFRILCGHERLAHCQVHLPVSDPRRVVDRGRHRFADVPGTAAGPPTASVRSGARLPGRGIAHPVAARFRRERTALERAGRRGGGIDRR